MAREVLSNGERKFPPTLRPGQRCLIVCPADRHIFAGEVCTTVEYWGVGNILLNNGASYVMDRLWHVSIDGRQVPTGYDGYASPEEWLVPLNGDPDQASTEHREKETPLCA